MIKTTVKCDYSKPNESAKLAYIVLTASYTMTPYDIKYNVQHDAIIDDITGSRTYVTSTVRNITIEQYNTLSNAVDSYITAFDVTTMDAFQIEQLRLKLGLFIYITMFDFLEDGVHVAYNLLPADWELVLPELPTEPEPEPES